MIFLGLLFLELANIGFTARRHRDRTSETIKKLQQSARRQNLKSVLFVFKSNIRWLTFQLMEPTCLYLQCCWSDTFTERRQLKCIFTTIDCQSSDCRIFFLIGKKILTKNFAFIAKKKKSSSEFNFSINSEEENMWIVETQS